jgi:hypothetical protein
MDRQVTPRLAPMIEGAIAALVPSEDVLWEYTATIVMTPGGPQPAGTLVLLARGAELGTWNAYTATVEFSHWLKMDQEAWNGFVKNGVEALVKARSEQLTETKPSLGLVGG